MDASCMPQSQCSPSINARISLSKKSEVPPVVGMQNSCLARACDDLQKMKEHPSDRNSMSEFEFAMCATAHDSPHGVVHMLAADELFFKGKLLPLYIPQFIDGPEQQTGSCNACDQAEQVSARTNCNEQALIADKPMTPYCRHEVNAEDLGVKSLDLVVPASPKAPRCSIKLKCIFGLKKFARSYCSCAASEEVNIASSAPAKLSRRKVHKTEKKKHRPASASLILEQNVALSVSKTRYLTCQMSDVNARNSASEPLLRCSEGSKELLPLGSADDTPKINLQSPNNLKHPEYLMQRFNAGTSRNSWCSDAARIACKQRCNNKVRDTDVDVVATHKNSDEVRISGSSEDATRLASQMVSHEEMHTCRGCGEEFCKESWKLMHKRNVGELSLEKAGSYDKLNAAYGSPKQQEATPTTLINGFKSLSISRTKSLERSSSYSPKSLQKKYDQLKLTRQREGWRVLERSSSYNGSMHSMRVAPVLNVPIVCMSRSKSSNNATDPGRGHYSLVPTRKNLDVNFRVVSGTSSSTKPTAASNVQGLKLLQSRRQSPHIFV